MLERFSIEFQKTKTKKITLANHNRRKQDDEPIRNRSNMLLASSAVKMRVSKSRLVLVSGLIGCENGASFLDQSQSIVKQN